jgi:hypothetical protein
VLRLHSIGEFLSCLDCTLSESQIRGRSEWWHVEAELEFRGFLRVDRPPPDIEDVIREEGDWLVVQQGVSPRVEGERGRRGGGVTEAEGGGRLKAEHATGGRRSLACNPAYCDQYINVEF